MITFKKMTLGFGVLVLFGACTPQETVQADKPKEIDLTSEKAQLGYTIGSSMASQLQAGQMFSKLDVEALIAAIRDTAEGKDPRLTVEQMQQAQVNFQESLQAEAKALSDANKTKGDEYLVEHAKKEGVLKTESGLQYEVLREGKGEALPTATDTVKVHYSGKLVDGTEFDSSYTRGEPTEFPVSGVIPGFSEGLQLMKAGGKYRFTIPSDQAYGVQGPPSIGPNQVLVFEVELIEIVTAAKTDAPK